MDLSGVVAALDGLATTDFDGHAYRHVSVGRDPLSGEGARLVGGRWNPPGSFAVLYLGADVATVVREFERLARKQGRAVDEFLPRDMFTYELRLQHLVGFVGWEHAKGSVSRVWRGIPDLRVDLHDVVEEGDRVFARLTAHGTHSGRLYGAPPTRRAYEVSMFDYVRLEEGRIVERVQQADNLGQMRQLFGPPLAALAVASAVALAGLGFALGRARR